MQKFIPHLFVNYISPVRWTETVEKMAQDGVEVLVEIGPGKIIKRFNKTYRGRITSNIGKRCASLDAC